MTKLVRYDLAMERRQAALQDAGREYRLARDAYANVCADANATPDQLRRAKRRLNAAEKAFKALDPRRT